MKLKYRLNELSRNRDRLLDFMRSDAIITRPDHLKICKEIIRMQEIIESINSLSVIESEREDDGIFFEMPSYINQKEPPIKKPPVKRKKKPKKLLYIPRTWETIN